MEEVGNQAADTAGRTLGDVLTVFFSWVFTFGGAIRIEGPAEVLEKMRDMATWLHT